MRHMYDPSTNPTSEELYRESLKFIESVGLSPDEVSTDDLYWDDEEDILHAWVFVYDKNGRKRLTNDGMMKVEWLKNTPRPPWAK